jgi:hypothetical protein
MNKELFIDYYGNGLDPTKIKEKEYVDNGIKPSELIDVIRERCIMCKETEIAIKNCNDLKCPSWPYRLGKNPFKETKPKWPKTITVRKSFVINIYEDETFDIYE